MTDQFLKKKYLNCPLIRIRVKESEYPGNRAACPEAVRKASSDPGEKNQSVSPRVAEVFCIWKSVLARGVVNRNDGKTRHCSGCWMVFAHPHTGRPGQCVRPSLGQDSRLGQPHKTPKRACENLSPESRAKAFSMGSARSFLVCANRWDHTGVEKLNPKSKNVACGLCV